MYTLANLVSVLFPSGTWGTVADYLAPETVAALAPAAAGLGVNPFGMPLDVFVEALHAAQAPFLGNPTPEFLATLPANQGPTASLYVGIAGQLGLPTDATNNLFTMPTDPGWQSTYQMELANATTATTASAVAIAPRVIVQTQQEHFPMRIRFPDGTIREFAPVNPDDMSEVMGLAASAARVIAIGGVDVLRDDGTVADVFYAGSGPYANATDITVDGVPLFMAIHLGAPAVSTAVITSPITPVVPVTVSALPDEGDAMPSYNLRDGQGNISESVSDPRAILNTILAGGDVLDSSGNVLQLRQVGSDSFNPANWMIDGVPLVEPIDIGGGITAAPYTGQGTSIPPTRVVVEGRGRIVTTMEELQDAQAHGGAIDTAYSSAVLPMLEGDGSLLTAAAIGATALALLYFKRKAK